MTPRGNNTLLVAVCVLTGYVFLRALKNKRTEVVTYSLLKIFCDFGTPRILHSDNDPTLVTDIHNNVCKILGIHTRTSIPYKPASLGKAERVVGVALTCIHKDMAALGMQWDLNLEFIQLYINIKIKDITGTDPFSLMFHRPCNIFHMQDPPEHDMDALRIEHPCAKLSLEQWIEHSKKLHEILFPAVRERVKLRQDATADRFSKTHTMSPRELPIGTLVAVKDVHRQTKLESPMLAPYTVHSKSDHGGYILRDNAGGILNRPVPIEHIRPLYNAKRPTPTIEQGSDCYVDFILNHRMGKDHRDEYLIKWMGTDEKTWVPASDIADYNLIHEYLSNRHKRLPKSRQKVREKLRANELKASEKSMPLSNGYSWDTQLDEINDDLSTVNLEKTTHETDKLYESDSKDLNTKCQLNNNSTNDNKHQSVITSASTLLPSGAASCNVSTSSANPPQNISSSSPLSGSSKPQQITRSGRQINKPKRSN